MALIYQKVPIEKTRIQLDEDSWIYYDPHFLSGEECASLYTHLYHDIPWRVSYRTYKDQKIELPRRQCWQSEPGVVAQLYQKEPALDWSPLVMEVKEKIENLPGISNTFNYCLFNLYRDGKDSIGFHKDDEAFEPGTTAIGSISVGTERKFLVKNRKGKIGYEFKLPGGTLIIMDGQTQQNWLHSVPRDDTTSPRINLTFRRAN